MRGILSTADVPMVDGMSPSRSLVIKVTCGNDAPERCNQAFTIAASAVAAGVPVSLWLTGNSSWFGVSGAEEELDLAYATPLPELRDAVLAGGRVTVCTQCAARRGIEKSDLLPGVRLADSAVFVEESLAPDAQALVY